MSNKVSSVFEQKKSDDVSTNSNTRDYTSLVICEETSDEEEDFYKAHASLPVHIFYSVLFNKITSLKPNALFGFVYNKLSAKKYLAISVLRI